MNKLSLNWFLALLLITSVCLPAIGNAAEVVAYSAEQTTHIRALAASCAACHGTFGNSVVHRGDEDKSGANAALAGMSATDFTEIMLGFRDGSRKATVMHHHAKGLTLDEINHLAQHFSQQKPAVKSPLKSQVLKADHE